MKITNITQIGMSYSINQSIKKREREESNALLPTNQNNTTQHTQLLSQLTMREMKSISWKSETPSGAFA